MNKGIEIINRLKDQIESSELLEKARERSQDFIRNRKVGFVSMMMLIMSLLRRSLQLELDEFIKKEPGAKTDTYTKQSFSEARQKIKPEVFLILNNELIRMLLARDRSLCSVGNYRPVIIAGMSMIVISFRLSHS